MLSFSQTAISPSYAIGLSKGDIAKAMGNVYTLKSTENGAAFMIYDYANFQYQLTLNSDYICYYATCYIHNAAAYNSAIQELNSHCKFIENNTWVNEFGGVIVAHKNVYQSGTVYSITYY